MLIIGYKYQETVLLTQVAIDLLTALGFNVHKEKSTTIPTQVITFLGFIVNSNSKKFTTRKSEENSSTLPTNSYGRRCISSHVSSATGGARVSSNSGVESPSSFLATSSTTKSGLCKKVNTCTRAKRI